MKKLILLIVLFAIIVNVQSQQVWFKATPTSETSVWKNERGVPIVYTDSIKYHITEVKIKEGDMRQRSIPDYHNIYTLSNIEGTSIVAGDLMLDPRQAGRLPNADSIYMLMNVTYLRYLETLYSDFGWQLIIEINDSTRITID